ncbi:MAG: GerW family sporulation protein [Anaerolineae bacterium]|jgi:LPXTG-motif cell wall-anchored protein
MVERLFQWLDGFKNANMVRAAFGEPYEAGGRTVIPTARVSYTLKAEGILDGEGEPSFWPQTGTGTTRPVALISIGSDGVRVTEVTDRSSMALLGAGLLALASALAWGFSRRRRD